jgi:hypothetical protein
MPPTVVLAPIPLARGALRLLVAPLILLVAGLVAMAGGLVLGGLPGLGLVIAGAIVEAFALYLVLVLLTLRLNVEVATLRLTWLGGERRYVLARGAVTRVPLRGPNAAQLRPRFGAVGWAMGPATLRRTEPIELVRLARSTSVILVPTDRGRLAIAPRSEQQLLTALSAAARVQQRLDEVASRARALPPPAPTRPLATAASAEVPAAAAEGAEAPRMLTGIERAILEERLAAERAAALAAAEAERQAAAEAARLASVSSPNVAEAAPAAPRRSARVRLRTTWSRPAWSRPEPVDLDRSLRRLAPFAAAALPLVAGLGLWAAAVVLGRLDMPDTQLRPVSLALAASGPLAALGALAAHTWYPRLLGLVVVSALAGITLVGRALLG